MSRFDGDNEATPRTPGNEVGDAGREREKEKEKDTETRPPSLNGEAMSASDIPILRKEGVAKIEALCMSHV